MKQNIDSTSHSSHKALTARTPNFGLNVRHRAKAIQSIPFLDLRSSYTLEIDWSSGRKSVSETRFTCKKSHRFALDLSFTIPISSDQKALIVSVIQPVASSFIIKTSNLSIKQCFLGT